MVSAYFQSKLLATCWLKRSSQSLLSFFFHVTHNPLIRISKFLLFIWWFIIFLLYQSWIDLWLEDPPEICPDSTIPLILEKKNPWLRLIIFCFCFCSNNKYNLISFNFFFFFQVPNVPMIPVFSLIFEFFMAIYLVRASCWLGFYWALIGKKVRIEEYL